MNIKSCLFQYLSCLDFFGIKPKLYINGKTQTSTTIGIIFSLIFILLTLLCFLYFGKDLYYLDNPIVAYNEKYDPMPEKYVLDPTKSPLVVEINSPYADEFYTGKTLISSLRNSLIQSFKQTNISC